MLLPNTPQQNSVTAAQKYATYANTTKPLLTVSPRTLVLLLSFVGLLLLFGVGYLLLQFINSNNVNPSNPSAQTNSNVLLSLSPSSGSISASGSNIDLNLNTQGTAIIVTALNISYDSTKVDVVVSKGTTNLNDLYNSVVSNGNIKIEAGTGGTFNSNGLLAKLQVTPKSGVSSGSVTLQVLSNSEIALENGTRQLFAASVYKSYTYDIGGSGTSATPSSVSLSPSTGSLSQSGTDIAVNLTAGSNITAVSVNVQYDQSQVDVVVTPGGTALDSLFIQTVAGGNINIQGGTNSGFSGNGKLANIKVTPKSGFSGTTRLKVLSNSITADTNGTTTNISPESLKEYSYTYASNVVTTTSNQNTTVQTTSSSSKTSTLSTTSKSSTTTVPNTGLVDDLRQNMVLIFAFTLIALGIGFTYLRNRSINRFGF